MATPLRCPDCAAEFDFAAWQKAASCPACGRRVRFEEAVAAAEAAGSEPLVAAPAAPAAVPGGSAPETRYLFGKPLRWTRAWTVVVLVWAVAAAGLVIARVEVGQSVVLMLRERGAVAAVQRAPLESGLTYGEAFLRVEKQLGVAPASARWYVQDRAWEKVFEVHQVLGRQDLAWAVSYGGKVAPDAGTAGILKELMQAGAGRPGGLPSLLPIPTL
ncbi:MAG TPA: zinc ribbon domain-containing protein [Gemmatimonadaceae bacterium]